MVCIIFREVLDSKINNTKTNFVLLFCDATNQWFQDIDGIDVVWAVWQGDYNLELKLVSDHTYLFWCACIRIHSNQLSFQCHIGVRCRLKNILREFVCISFLPLEKQENDILNQLRVNELLFLHLKLCCSKSVLFPGVKLQGNLRRKGNSDYIHQLSSKLCVVLFSIVDNYI